MSRPFRTLALALEVSTFALLPGLPDVRVARAQAEPTPSITVNTFLQRVETPYLRVQFDTLHPDRISGLVYKERDPFRDLGPDESTLLECFGGDMRGTASVGSIDSRHLAEMSWEVESEGTRVVVIRTRTVTEDRPPVRTRYWFYADQGYFVVERTIEYSQVPYTGRYQDWIPRVAFYDTYRAMRYRDSNGVLQQRGWCATPCVTQGWDGRWLQQVGYRLGMGQSVATIYPSSVPANQPFVRGMGPNTYAGWAAPLWDSLAYTTDVTRRTLVAFSTQPDSVGRLDSLWTAFNSPAFTLEAPAPARGAELRLALAPNPSRGPVALSATLPRAQHARLEVLDLSGRRVATLFDGDAPAGELRARWTGRTETEPDAHESAPGIYWARLVTPDGTLTKTIVRVR